MCMLQAVFPAVKSHQIRKGGTKFALSLAEVINDTILVMEGIQVSFNSLYNVVRDYNTAQTSSL